MVEQETEERTRTYGANSRCSSLLGMSFHVRRKGSGGGQVVTMAVAVAVIFLVVVIVAINRSVSVSWIVKNSVIVSVTGTSTMLVTILVSMLVSMAVVVVVTVHVEVTGGTDVTVDGEDADPAIEFTLVRRNKFWKKLTKPCWA